MSGVYAQVADGAIVNTALWDEAPAGWVPLAGVSPQPGIGWSYDGSTFRSPAPAPGPPLPGLQAALCADIDRQAEAQRQMYITGGDGQMAVYLQKQTQAAAALAGAAAEPPMSAQAGASAYVLLAAEVGITVDPATGQPATDVFGVARAVSAVVAVWLPAAAAIERVRLACKAAVTAATTATAAQAAHDAVAWPAAPAA